MAIQSSGAVALSEVQSEFGGVNPISLSEYYRSGTYVPSGATGVPANGAISIGDFYGASNSYAFTIAANTQNADVRALAIADGWDQSTPLSVTVNSGVWCYSDTTSTGGLVLAGSFAGGVTVVNSGNIIGMGGAANQAGGPALQITTSDTVNIINNSGAYIAGGGGGGGGSFSYSVAGAGTYTGYLGGGGAGQAGAFGDTSSRNGSLFGWNSSDVTIGRSCTGVSGTSDNRAAVQSRGYGYGGGGGSGASAGSYTTYYICNGSGGWYQVTSYVQGPAQGGRALTGGSTGTPSSNAGGFWGQPGGAGGGAGGSAISGAYAGYTNNGTVYGAVV